MWLKGLKYFFIGLGILIVITITVLFSIIYFYEDEIKQYALNELNQHLEADLKVDNIELSIFEQFPSIALKFNNVFIKDKLDHKDTLLYAKSLYMNMDFFDVIKGNYEVRKIIGDHVNLKLKVDSNGNDNYNIWVSDTLSKGEEVRFVLQQVEVNNLKLDYLNDYNKQHYRFQTKHIDFSGDFNKSIYDLRAKSHVLVNEFSADHVSYLTNKRADIDLNVKVNNDSSTYLINKGDLKIEGMAFAVQGSYRNGEAPYIDLNFIGKSIILESLISVFPIDILASINEYKAKGEVGFNASLLGKVSSKDNPVFKADFNMKSGSMKETYTATTLSSISLNGRFININEEGVQELELDKFQATLGDETIVGSLKITNFNQPIIEGSVDGKIELKKMADFASLNSFNLDGNADLALSYKIRFNNQGNDYDLDVLKGSIKLLDMIAVLPEHEVSIEQTNGQLSFVKNALKSNLIKGKVNGSDFEMQITFENFMDYVTTISDKLKIISDLKINKLILDQMISSGEGGQGDFKFNLPSQIELNSNLSIGLLQYNSFKAKNISGSFNVNDRYIKADNVFFEANKGKYELSSSLKPIDENNYKWSVVGNAYEINISDLFYSFENFGQSYLTGLHLKGLANISFDVSSLLDKALTFDADKITAKTQIRVKNGELIKHSSMTDIADYLDDNILVKTVIDTKVLKNKLTHIHFRKLSNEITITNGIIAIPKMNIESSVMNMTLFGTHGFNDSIDYHFSFRLRELMVKDKVDSEFGPIKDDGLGKKLFLHMYGTVDDPLFKLDQNEKKQIKKEVIEKEKKEIKSILKDEFGLFSKDSTLKSNNTEKKDTVIFKLEWEEETNESQNNSETKKLEDKDTTKKKNGKLNKFLKKIGVEEEEKKEVEFEIDQDN